MNYHFSRQLDTDFAETETRVVGQLEKEGFGVLTKIDVQATLKKKLGVDFPPYKILGACNPNFAYQALQVESHIGTMLPCNVILRELPEGGIEVSAVDPLASMQAIENPELRSIAEQVRNKLKNVITSL
ncbi:MAG: DUF302 domain-containing protein [Deltaproteobacteria bacterium]|nr:DUF302 domain-containing protein [Deltaproteobacteria bacterium]MBW2042575.1 DUF302 domain-containing protein [Deltaproteobacteria bacterium]MBW2130929.1 DUF302 domain-containing protein [Deltaproteobacteria bacterium]